MVSSNNISSPTITTTPKQMPINHSTPLAQKINTNTSFNFDDTPVAKMDMSPPLLVEPGKGSGKIQKQVSFTVASPCSDEGKAEVELASPIFSNGPQYPALDGHVSENRMEGVEPISNSGSELADNSSSEEALIRVLVPSIDNLSQDMGDFQKRIQIEWIGTSTFFFEHNIELQGAVSFT
jgi:hypothetical protein